MEKQNDGIGFEIVTNEYNTWVVPHCNTFIARVAAIQLDQAISRKGKGFFEVILQLFYGPSAHSLLFCPRPVLTAFCYQVGLQGTNPNCSSGSLRQ